MVTTASRHQKLLTLTMRGRADCCLHQISQHHAVVRLLMHGQEHRQDGACSWVEAPIAGIRFSHAKLQQCTSFVN